MELRCNLEDCLERCRSFKFHRYFVSMIYQRLGVLESEYHFGFEINKGLDYSGVLESLGKLREALVELKSKPQFELSSSNNSQHWVSYYALSLIFNQFLRKLEQSGFQNSTASIDKSKKDTNSCINTCSKWFKSLQMSSDSGMRLDIFEHLDCMKELLKSRKKQLVPRKELQAELTMIFWYTELESICQSNPRAEVSFVEFERALDGFSNKLEGLRLPEGNLVKILSEKSISNALGANITQASVRYFNASDINIILPMIYANPIIKYTYFVKSDQSQQQQQQQLYSQLLQQQQQLQQLSIQKTISKDESIQSVTQNQQTSPGTALRLSQQQETTINTSNTIASTATCVIQRDSKNLLNSCENPQSFSVIPSSLTMHNQSSQYLQSRALMMSRSQLQSEGDLNLPVVEMDDSYKPPSSISLQMIECQTDLINLNLFETIIIHPNTVQLGSNQPQPLRHKHIVCFGRQSKNNSVTKPLAGGTQPNQNLENNNSNHSHRNMYGIQNDVQFKPEVWRVSRQQFRIIWNSMDYYSIVCTSPSNPTMLRLNDISPVELLPNMVFRIADYKFLVNDLSHGTQDIGEEQELEDFSGLFEQKEQSPNQPRLIKLSQNPDSELQLLLKQIPQSIQEINFLENSSSDIPHTTELTSSIKSFEPTLKRKNYLQNNPKSPQKSSPSPFIELSCIAGDYKTSEGKDIFKMRFEVAKDREIITFGRDQRNKFPFSEKEVSRFHCQIVYDSQKRWKLCEKYIPDQKHLSSGGTYVQLQSFDQNKNESYSDPWPLQEGMLIHSEGATFKVL